MTENSRLPLPPVTSPPSAHRRYHLTDFRQLPPVRCPCGWARRAFQDVDDFPGTIHVTDIELDARLHYHKTLTETYYFLECDEGARMQLDEEMVPVSPGTCVVIPPGVRHRAIGRMRVLIVVLPKFNPDDEWFDAPRLIHHASPSDSADATEVE